MGTRLQVFRKLPLQTRAGGKLTPRDPSEAVVGSDLLVNDFQVERAYRDLVRISTQIGMDAMIPWDGRELIDLEQNEASCFGPYGNSPCAFLDICDGYTTLSDPHLFEDWDPDARYTDLELANDSS
jgi:hypothetical protein